MKEIYLDNSATTKTCQSAINKMVYIVDKCYANPSSLHSKGFEAEREIEGSREEISNFLGCRENEIYFTSGGTESNNISIFGAANARKRYGNKIITTAVEHSSVLEPLKQLEKQGMNVIYISPDRKGNISIEDLSSAVDGQTILVSVMMVNNETGALYPVNQISDIVRKKAPRAIFHVDAVQAFGKININFSDIDTDLMSVSSHKMNGPKGIGALYISQDVKISPLVFGGGQEKGIRPGTQPVPLICGFSEAVKDLNLISDLEKISDINLYCKDKLLNLDGIHINSPDNGSPYIINFSVKGIRSETMLHYLSSKGIYISSGSACAKGKKSHVLSAMELPGMIIDSALRVSFSRYSTKEEIDILVSEISQGIKNIIKV